MSTADPEFTSFEEICHSISRKDPEYIVSWINYFFKYFPPIVYEMAPLLLPSLKGHKSFISILRLLYYNCPDLVYTYAAQNTLIYKDVYGTSLKVKNPYVSDRVVLYSKKFNENWVSSQEAYRPIIEGICANYNVLLVSPSSSPASTYYQSLGEYLEIPSDDASLVSVNKILDPYEPRVLIEMTPMEIPSTLSLDRTYTAQIDGCVLNEHNGRRRMPDFAIKDIAAARKIYPGNSIQFEEAFAYSMPSSNSTRNYKLNYDQMCGDKEIHFGAFCRLSKLDLFTLNLWSSALNAFPSSKLYFAYIQSNKVSEYYTKKYFESQSIDPERIIFFPRLNTNDYLTQLSKMDIVFGASPEQGGVSCTDALAMGVPYLVNSINSITTTADHVLKLIGKSEWSVKSCSEFLFAIEHILSTSKNTKNFFNRTMLLKQVTSQMEMSQDSYQSSVFKMLDRILYNG